MYLLEVKQYQVLSSEEQTELAVRVREEEDQEAARILVTSNLRLVVKIAMDFSRCWGKNLLDLIQEGNTGLVHAVRKYDPYRGVKFSYYAAFWIKAYILKYIMDNWKLVKIGTTQSQRKLFFNLSRERDKLLAEGFRPEPKMLAQRLDAKEEEVEEMTKRLAGWEVSIDAPYGEDSRESYGAFLPDPGVAIDEQISSDQRRKLLMEKISEFRKTLSKKEADIFDNRIMAEKAITLQVLGDRYNLSRERIRQIQKKITHDTRRWLKKNIPGFEEVYADIIE
jgi:RNA polymerase sigma-32 factor